MLAGGIIAAALVIVFTVLLDGDDAANDKSGDSSAATLTYREVGTAAQVYPDLQGKSIGESGEPLVRQGNWATTVIQVGVDDPQTASTSRVLLHYVDGAWKMVASDDASKFCDEVPSEIQDAMFCV